MKVTLLLLLLATADPNVSEPQGPSVLGAGVGDSSVGLSAAFRLGPSAYHPGVGIAAERMFALVDLTPRLRVDLGPRLSLAYHRLRRAAGYRGSALFAELVPNVRFKYACGDRFGFFSSYGLGLVYSYFTDVPHSPADNSLLFTVQLGGGALYALSSSTRLLIDVRLHVYPKSGSNGFVALPTLGMEF